MAKLLATRLAALERTARPPRHVARIEIIDEPDPTRRASAIAQALAHNAGTNDELFCIEIVYEEQFK